MRGLLQPTNKRAVSEMVSYVLLVVIAVGLSIAVYAYLKVFVPKGEKPECKEDIQLTLQNYTCNYNPASSGSILSVSLYNRGLFKVNEVILRLGKEGKTVRTNVQDTLFTKALSPGESANIKVEDKSKLSPILTTNGTYTLEIQPAAMNDKGERAICDKAVITQTIICDSV